MNGKLHMLVDCTYVINPEWSSMYLNLPPHISYFLKDVLELSYKATYHTHKEEEYWSITTCKVMFAPKPHVVCRSIYNIAKAFLNTKANIKPLEIKAEINITQQCVERLKKISNTPNDFLRVTVEGGGCSGFQYKFDLDTKIEDDDKIFKQDGVKVVVDSISLDYIKGSTLDYQEELIRSSFKIVNNPLAEKGCSCGASFAVRLD